MPELDQLNEAFSIMHSYRLKIAYNQQPTQASKLDSLNNILSANSIKHPYYLSSITRDSLIAYQKLEGANCVKYNKSGYYYRICSMSKVINEKNGANKAMCPTFESIFSLRDYKNTGWIPLKYFFKLSPFTKILPTPTSYSFWTSESIDNIEDIIMLVKRLGLPFEWVLYSDPIILKADSKFLPEDYIQIPSVIAGYDSPIFLPSQLDCPSPTTLNLDSPPTFNGGMSEVIIKDVPIDAVSIKPLNKNIASLIKPLKETLSIYKYNILHEQLNSFYKLKSI